MSIHPRIKTTDISQRAIPKILFIWWCNSQMKVRVYSQLSVNLGYVSLCQLMCWNRLFDGQMTFLLLLMFNELKPVHLLSIWGWREYKSQWQRKTKGKNKVKQKKCSSFNLHQRPMHWKNKIITSDFPVTAQIGPKNSTLKIWDSKSNLNHIFKTKDFTFTDFIITPKLHQHTPTQPFTHRT